MTDHAPCAGLWTMFDSTDPVDHLQAAQLCADCPMIAACREAATEATKAASPGCGAQGTWGGRLYLNGVPVAASAQDHLFDVAADPLLREIHNVVIDRTGVNIHQLLGTSRRVDIAAARHVTWWVLHMHGVSNSEIGRLCNRHHTTVAAGFRHVRGDRTLLALAEAIYAETVMGVAA